MKKLLMIFAVLGFIAMGSISPVAAQDEDVLAMDDTLSIDDMDPVFYEAEQSEGSGSTTTILVIAGVVVVAAGVYFFTRKKKN
ncbi:LPXTG cell wall anchor domain-containing protein [Sunxiuqinia sp. A32]|uniref:LPXTG cell wall anchor domain-containing protein n=1 Tax=Sunxiuqinia sp. A32 TaxID=3461496 RepID=UPI00404527F4